MIHIPDNPSRPEVTPEGSRAIQEIVAEYAADDTTSWESIAAAVCVVLQFFFIPPIIASRIPSVVQFPISLSAMHIALGSLAAGLGFSALRQSGRKGRFIGAISFLIGITIVYNWGIFIIGSFLRG